MNTLRVIREVDHGYYLLGDENWEDILLPRKLVSSDMDIEIDDEIEVFVHFDSKDRICATPQIPYAMVGDFASLQVSKVEEFGVFLDWGLDKELFVPFREQLFKMNVGQFCAVYVYVDKSERIAATTRISKFFDKTKPNVKVGDEVDLLLYQVTDMGIKAIINNQYSGLIYKDDVRSKLVPGQKIKGYIYKIREDFKIDLSLQPEGLKGRKDLSEQIMEKLQEEGGVLNITAKTSSEEISRIFGVSRKKFKVALGFLYKQNRIIIDNERIYIPQNKE